MPGQWRYEQDPFLVVQCVLAIERVTDTDHTVLADLRGFAGAQQPGNGAGINTGGWLTAVLVLQGYYCLVEQIQIVLTRQLNASPGILATGIDIAIGLEIFNDCGQVRSCQAGFQKSRGEQQQVGTVRLLGILCRVEKVQFTGSSAETRQILQSLPQNPTNLSASGLYRLPSEKGGVNAVFPPRDSWLRHPH